MNLDQMRRPHRRHRHPPARNLHRTQFSTEGYCTDDNAPRGSFAAVYLEEFVSDEPLATKGLASHISRFSGMPSIPVTGRFSKLSCRTTAIGRRNQAQTTAMGRAVCGRSARSSGRSNKRGLCGTASRLFETGTAGGGGNHQPADVGVSRYSVNSHEYLKTIRPAIPRRAKP